MSDILLLEDDHSIAHVIMAALQAENWSVDHCVTIKQRDAALATRPYTLMLTDVVLEDGDGIDSLAHVQAVAPDMPVIVLSAQNTLDTAVRAADAFAFEYFPKPFDLDELVRAVSSAIGNAAQKAGPGEGDAFDSAMPLVGRSPAMQTVYRMITRVLRNDLSVLVLGESGTGKELVAQAIHDLGHRKQGPFVPVNMAAIPAELVESELFGHEKGAFTGAVARKIGKFEQANGGTLFLDEIGDMPMQAQTRLLRALQSGRITRVGGNAEITLDVRIISATNKGFAELIERGLFREDLYYRLNVVPIHLPPLRERHGDIGSLAQHFLGEAEREGLPRRRFDNAALSRLEQHGWRGNVRELRNFVYRIVIMSREDVIGEAGVLALLDEGSASDTDRMSNGHSSANGAGAGYPASMAACISALLSSLPARPGAVYDQLLAEMERPLLTEALALHGGNQLKAAQWLGINRNTLRKKLTDLALDNRMHSTD